jgi:hypothetical protein
MYLRLLSTEYINHTKCSRDVSSGVGRVGMIWKLIFGEGSTGAA